MDADAVAETVQSNYMSFLPLLPEVPGGSRHDWEALAPLPVQQARPCSAPWQHAPGVTVPDPWCECCQTVLRSSCYGAWCVDI